MDEIRKPYQGVWNIVRFNWHYYILSALFLAALLFLVNHLGPVFRTITIILILLAIAFIIISLVVSAIIYDISGLYKLTWLNFLKVGPAETLINIHAGFDETSRLLKAKYSEANLLVLDFYDPAKHTEVSIKRARKAYPPYPGTISTSTTQLAIEGSKADKVFSILSAHEIRNEEERIAFFKEIHRILKPSGAVIITEHLRDLSNFLAYNIGFFHFQSRARWLHSFECAGLKLKNEIKITPFITTFILEKNGTSS